MKNMCNGVPIQKRNATIHVPCLWIQRLWSPRILIRLILSVLIYQTTINFVWYCKKIKRLTAIVLPWPVSCASASVQWPLGVGKGSTHGMQSVNNNKCIDLSGQSSENSSVWRIILIRQICGMIQTHTVGLRVQMITWAGYVDTGVKNNIFIYY